LIKKLILGLLVGAMWLLGATALAYQEAPMLRVKVAAGEIPPVEERLPDEPKVVEPVEEIGRYGGTLHAFATNISCEGGDLNEHIDVGNPYLLELTKDGPIIGNLAKGYELSDDAKSCTVYLRKGARWSDGHPFTADDIVFMFEGMHWNDQVTTWFMYEGVSRVKKIDDYTVRFEMDEPYPSIEVNLAGWSGGEWGAFAPKHYLKKWHIKYNPKADELAKEEGFDNWWEAFHYHWWYDPTRDINKPTMRPWMFKELTPTVKVFERNPYFYQVDKEGNQLPYVDRIVSTIVNEEVYQMKIIAGEADVALWFTSMANYSLYKEHEEEGGYRVHKIPGVCASEAAFGINQNHPDPFLRRIFQDVRFRQALSLAINREEINDTVYFGLGVPSQATALPSCRFYKEEWAKAYVQYDPEEANRLLDEVGLTERDKNGFRIGPDGKAMLLLVEYNVQHGIPLSILELVKEYWEDVGLKVALKGEDPGLWNQRGEAIDHMIMVHPYADTGEIADYGWKGRAAPGGGGLAWCPAWSQWLSADEAVRTGKKKLEDYEGGKLPGEEPPEEIKQLEQWCLQKMRTRFASKEYVELMQKIYDFQAEKLYVIGTVGMVPTLYIAKKEIGNIPKAFPVDQAFFGDLYNEAQQLFWKK